MLYIVSIDYYQKQSKYKKIRYFRIGSDLVHFWVVVLKILGYEDSSSEGVTSKWDATRTIRRLGMNMGLKKIPCEGVFNRKLKLLHTCLIFERAITASCVHSVK